MLNIKDFYHNAEVKDGDKTWYMELMTGEDEIIITLKLKPPEPA